MPDKKVSELVRDLESLGRTQHAVDVTVSNGGDATDYRVVITRIRRRKQGSVLGRVDEWTISTAPVDSGKCSCCGQ